MLKYFDGYKKQGAYYIVCSLFEYKKEF